MLTEADLHPYQRKAIEHILAHENAMLWLDMGLGKTTISLYAFKELQNRWATSAALVVGPKRVVESVWRAEAQKWAELRGLRFSLIGGDEAMRKRQISRRADLYLINYEQLEWLVSWVGHRYLNRGEYPPFDMVIYDEVTKVKNADAKRSQAIHRLLPWMRRRMGLTGEPAANGYKDLHGQYLAVDGGRRLGTDLRAFKSAFLTEINRRAVVTNLGREQIKRRIHDITLEMSADDYLDLPPIIQQDIEIDLPPDARRIYEEVETRFFHELAQGGKIEAQTEATKGLKCLQVAGGACYIDDSDRWASIHTAKLDALETLLEERNGRPLLLGFGFRHEAARIKARFPFAQFLSSELSEKEFARIERAWNAEDVPLLCGHPASMGHGLNLQFGGDALCWFGLNWSLELYNQFNARLMGGHRRRNRVFLYRILARDTMDEALRIALENKAATQAALKRAINEYRARRLAQAA